MKGLLGVAALAVGAAGLPNASIAQATCAERERVTLRLEQQFGEQLTGGGLRSDAHLIEVWTSPKTGTWTVLMTNASGLSCVMASGTDWHQAKLETLMGVPG